MERNHVTSVESPGTVSKGASPGGFDEVSTRHVPPGNEALIAGKDGEILTDSLEPENFWEIGSMAAVAVNLPTSSCLQATAFSLESEQLQTADVTEVNQVSGTDSVNDGDPIRRDFTSETCNPAPTDLVAHEDLSDITLHDESLRLDDQTTNVSSSNSSPGHGLAVRFLEELDCGTEDMECTTAVITKSRTETHPPACQPNSWEATQNNECLDELSETPPALTREPLSGGERSLKDQNSQETSATSNLSADPTKLSKSVIESRSSYEDVRVPDSSGEVNNWKLSTVPVSEENSSASPGKDSTEVCQPLEITEPGVDSSIASSTSFEDLSNKFGRKQSEQTFDICKETEQDPVLSIKTPLSESRANDSNQTLDELNLPEITSECLVNNVVEKGEVKSHCSEGWEVKDAKETASQENDAYEETTMKTSDILFFQFGSLEEQERISVAQDGFLMQTGIPPCLDNIECIMDGVFSSEVSLPSLNGVENTAQRVIATDCGSVLAINNNEENTTVDDTTGTVVSVVESSISLTIPEKCTDDQHKAEESEMVQESVTAENRSSCVLKYCVETTGDNEDRILEVAFQELEETLKSSGNMGTTESKEESNMSVQCLCNDEAKKTAQEKSPRGRRSEEELREKTNASELDSNYSVEQATATTSDAERSYKLDAPLNIPPEVAGTPKSEFNEEASSSEASTDAGDKHGLCPLLTKVGKQLEEEEVKESATTTTSIYERLNETHGEVLTAVLSKPNNGHGDDGHSCFSSPGDVTSVEDAKQVGKRRVVQGSHREYAIGEVYYNRNYSVTRVVSTPPPLGIVCAPPAYDNQAPPPTLQMAEGSWNSHDPPNERAPGIRADRLGRLDELAAHLYDLARQEDSASATTIVDDAIEFDSSGISSERSRKQTDNSDESVVQSERHGASRNNSDATPAVLNRCDKRFIDCFGGSEIVTPVHEVVCLPDVVHGSIISLRSSDDSSAWEDDQSLTTGYPKESSFATTTEADDISSTSATPSDAESNNNDIPGTDEVFGISGVSERSSALRHDEPVSVDIFIEYPKSCDESLQAAGKYHLEIVGSDDDDRRTRPSSVSPERSRETILELSSKRDLVLQKLKILTTRLKYPSELWKPGSEPGGTLGARAEASSDLQQGQQTELSGKGVEMYVSQSPRRVRLQKLLERNNERQERLKHLNGIGSGDFDNRGETHSPEDNEDPNKTLQALEVAIGHMQQLIKKDEPFRCQDAPELHLNELQFSTIEERRTIDTGFRAEVHERSTSDSDGHYINYPNKETCGDLYSVDGHDKHNIVNLRSGITPSWNSEGESDSFNTSKTRQSRDMPGNSKVSETLSTIQKHSSRLSSSPAAPYAKVTKKEVVTECHDNRWRSCGQAPTAFSTGDRSKGYAAEWSGGEVKKLSYGVKECRCEACRSTESAIVETCLEKRQRSDPAEPADEKSNSESTAGWHWQPRDVRTPPGQSPIFRGRGEHVSAAPRMLFSDELKREDVIQMQSGGGCEMEVSSPSKTANAATNTTPTPTKIKNLRFKLDPDIYDLPSENGYYDYDDDYNRRPNWKKQSKYHAFSSLELGRSNEPVKVVSVRTSVVPGGQKMVVKPVCVSEGQRPPTHAPDDSSRVTVKHLDIDLRIRLETEEREKSNQKQQQVVEVKVDRIENPECQTKRSYFNNVPAQSKRRSPIPDFSGWNQSLSPVSENCDWMPATSSRSSKELAPSSGLGLEKPELEWDPDQEIEPEFLIRNARDSLDTSSFTEEQQSNQSSDDVCNFKDENNQLSGPFTSTPSRPSTLALNQYRKNFQLPRKKFVPDPEAVERITGYKAAEEKSLTKPPLPPVVRSLSSHRLSSGSKSRIDQLRKRYLDSKSLIAAQRADASSKFEQFLNRAQEDRTKLVTSTPDLAAFEAAVRSQWSKARKAKDAGVAGKENAPPSANEYPDEDSAARGSTPDDVWLNYVQSLRRKLYRRSQSLSYLETDIDAFFADEKCRSMSVLERSPPDSTQSLVAPSSKMNRVGASLEESGRTKSEHELRVEKSLQNLTVPDWYKHSQRPKTGFLLDKKKTDEKKGWAAAKSLTSSTSSLTSVGSKPKRPARSLRTSRENLLWSRGSSSPASADNSYNRWGRTHSGPVLSLALAKAFREPYLGWRTRTPSSCASPSPQLDCSPPSWVVMDSTDRSDTPLTSDLQAMDEEDDTGFSFEGEDVLETADSSNKPADKVDNIDSPLPSADDTCEDVVNISMGTYDEQPVVNGHFEESQELANEDTCDDIKNITMETFELAPPALNEEPKQSPIGDDTSDDILNISTDTSSHFNEAHDGLQGLSSVVGATEDTGDDIDNISTDVSSPLILQPATNGARDGSISPMQDIIATTDSQLDKFATKPRDSKERSKFDQKRKRYSYNWSVYQNELDGVKGRDEQRAALDGSSQSLPGENTIQKGNKVIWIESSFVGSRTTTSIMVMPTEADIRNGNASCKGSTGSNSSVGRPASR